MQAGFCKGSPLPGGEVKPNELLEMICVVEQRGEILQQEGSVQAVVNCCQHPNVIPTHFLEPHTLQHYLHYPLKTVSVP